MMLIRVHPEIETSSTCGHSEMVQMQGGKALSSAAYMSVHEQRKGRSQRRRCAISGWALIRLFLMVMSGFLAASCFTMRIQNSQEAQLPPDESLESLWSHTGLFGLYNYSGAHSLSKLCPASSWKVMRFSQGAGPIAVENTLSLAAAFGPVGIGAGATAVNFLWDPLSLEWQCAESQTLTEGPED